MMAERLQEAEQTVLELRKALEAKSLSPPQHTAFAESSVSWTVSGHSPTSSAQSEGRKSFPQRQDRSPSKEPTSEMLSDLSLDEHGKVSSPASSLVAALLSHKEGRYPTMDPRPPFMSRQH